MATFVDRAAVLTVARSIDPVAMTYDTRTIPAPGGQEL